MAEPEIQPSSTDVDAFLAGVADPVRRADVQALCQLMIEVTGEQPVMWGTTRARIRTAHQSSAQSTASC